MYGLRGIIRVRARVISFEEEIVEYAEGLVNVNHHDKVVMSFHIIVPKPNNAGCLK
jgi:hypothetical protein